MKHKIGIIGGAGFIGTSLARYFVKNFQVNILDVKSPPKDLKEAAKYCCCDIRNYKDVAKGLEDVDLVIHAAIVQIPLINEQKKFGYEVNVIGTQNVCKAVEENPEIKGMILAGSWHTIGERDLKGVIDEEFGFRPDKVENRARLYALSKMTQEAIARFYDEMSDNKIYGIIRMGTVLGYGMPEKTAANIFIEQGFKRESITPYKHSMHRPMLYVDVTDICKAFEVYTNKILNKEIRKSENSLAHIVNIYYPDPITILDLAKIIRDSIIDITNGRVKPKIEIVDKGMPPQFTKDDKKRIKVNIYKAKEHFGLNSLKSPKESVREIIRRRFEK